MPDSITSQLMAPFDEDQKKTRKKTTQMTLTYVGWWEYAKRLNEVFGANWSFEVNTFDVVKIGDYKQAIVKATVTAFTSDGREIKKTAFGGSKPRVITDISDAYKAACSDALRKCASYFGIGLELLEKKKGSSKSKKASGASKGSEPIAPQGTIDAIIECGKKLGHKHPNETLYRVKEALKNQSIDSLLNLRHDDAQKVLERMQKKVLELEKGKDK